VTILYPPLGSAKLKTYEAPFGRMMLAYGRAIAAIIALAAAALGSEAKAVLWFNESSTDQLPKRTRRMFRGELNEPEFAELSAAVTTLKRVTRKRHHLIHGEWWFNAFENGQLTIRGVRSRRSKNQSWLNKLATFCGLDKNKEREIVGMKIEHLATFRPTISMSGPEN
jgi:hypothetical protein